jgi:hypothetical protein
MIFVCKCHYAECHGTDVMTQHQIFEHNCCHSKEQKTKKCWNIKKVFPSLLTTNFCKEQWNSGFIELLCNIEGATEKENKWRTPVLLHKMRQAQITCYIFQKMYAFDILETLIVWLFCCFLQSFSTQFYFVYLFSAPLYRQWLDLCKVCCL